MFQCYSLDPNFFQKRKHIYTMSNSDALYYTANTSSAGTAADTQDSGSNRPAASAPIDIPNNKTPAAADGEKKKRAPNKWQLHYQSIRKGQTGPIDRAAITQAYWDKELEADPEGAKKRMEKAAKRKAAPKKKKVVVEDDDAEMQD